MISDAVAAPAGTATTLQAWNWVATMLSCKAAMLCYKATMLSYKATMLSWVGRRRS